jgi:N-acetylglucosaminyl-diphospho-decaprenol L-rhamnosyltransferase
MTLAGPDSIALVTVTYNSAPELEALLRSVDRHLPGTRVIVVDCASRDNTLDCAHRWSCAVPIALERNVGFGSATNRGVLEVREPVMAVVNPDVELLDDSLLALASEALRPGGETRLLAPLVLSGDGSRQDTVHPVPGSPAELLRALIPPGLAPGRIGRELAPWRAADPRRVGWAVGCALGAQTATLRRLGPFDERIFLFSEDLDLGLRAAESGVQTWFWPYARVLHHGGRSTERVFDGEPFERKARARREVIARRLGQRRSHLDDAAQALTFASRVAAKRMLGRPTERERRQLQALMLARYGVRGGPVAGRRGER